MKILLVSATALEIAPTLSYLQTVCNEKKLYTTAHPHIDVLITGIGIPAASYYLGKYLNNSYDWVINAGIAGCFQSDISIGEVVHVSQDGFVELGKIQNGVFSSFIEKQVMRKEDIYFENTGVPGSQKLHSLLKVNGITVNTTNNLRKEVLEKLSYIPHTESMEGAAVMYACRQENIPCLQIRSISNYVEEQDTKKWNIPLAVNNLNEALQEILKELSA